MNAVLIPFFLAASVSVNDNEKWTYGPEYTYEGEFRSGIQNTTGLHTELHMQYLLKCRNKDTHSLQCQISDLEPKDAFQGEIPIEFKKLVNELTSNPFEISFNESGLESVTIADMNSTYSAAFSAIASLFNIGTNLKQRTTTRRFTTLEKTILGECDTDYIADIAPSEASPEQFVYQGKHFELSVIPYANLESRLNYEFMIRRNPESCGTNIGFGNFIGRNSDSTLISFKSRINVANRELFRSMSLAELRLKKTLDSKPFTVEMRFYLHTKLVSIDEAKGPLVPIANPKTVDFCLCNHE